MPYIDQKDRFHIADHMSISAIADILRKVPSGKVKGACNYTVSRIVAQAMKPEEGWGYSSLSEAIGCLEDAAAEMRRRLLDPYEDKAIAKNKDLPEYDDPF